VNECYLDVAGDTGWTHHCNPWGGLHVWGASRDCRDVSASGLGAGDAGRRHEVWLSESYSRNIAFQLGAQSDGRSEVTPARDCKRLNRRAADCRDEFGSPHARPQAQETASECLIAAEKPPSLLNDEMLADVRVWMRVYRDSCPVLNALNGLVTLGALVASPIGLRCRLFVALPILHEVAHRDARQLEWTTSWALFFPIPTPKDLGNVHRQTSLRQLPPTQV
jgi:hypothetical protein